MKIDKSLLVKLKKRMPKGYSTLLATKLQVSSNLVEKVISGNRTDHHGIIEAAIKLAEKTEKKRKEIESKI